MLHTKFCGNWPTSSREEDLKDFNIYGHGGHLGHVTKISRTKFQCHYQRRTNTKFQLDRPSDFREDL